MRKKSKLFAVILVLSLLACSQKETFAAAQEHTHNLVVLKTEIVSIKEDSCTQNENCVIRTILYKRTYVCTVSGCGFQQFAYKIQTDHTIEH